MDPSEASMFLILIFLLFSSAFFSSAETALTTVNKLRIRSLVEKNVKSAKIVAKLFEKPSKLLSTILIGNNIVNLTASSLATTLAIQHSKQISVGLATAILTFVIILLGEIIPKFFASTHAEKMALAYANIIYFFTKILTPIIFLIDAISHSILRLFGFDPNAKQNTITENELRTMVNVSHEEGILESEERKMITNVVDFGDSLAKDVMVPRIDMEFADINLTYDELVHAFGCEKYTRMPVYSETRDNVVGIVHLKDLFFYQGNKDQFSIEQIMRKPYFTYEYKKTSELLLEMRKESIYLAIVLDEYGATAGLITLEDLIEEIIGEIRDEYDEDEEDQIQYIAENQYLVNGTTRLEDINEAFHLHIESDDYDSIAGHIIHLLDHLPQKGESVKEENVVFTVHSRIKNRIDKINVRIIPSLKQTEQQQASVEQEQE